MQSTLNIKKKINHNHIFTK